MAQADAERIVRLLRENTLPGIADILGIPVADLHAQLLDPAGAPPLPASGGGGGVPDYANQVSRLPGLDGALDTMIASNGAESVAPTQPTKDVLVEFDVTLNSCIGDMPSVTISLVNPGGGGFQQSRFFLQDRTAAAGQPTSLVTKAQFVVPSGWEYTIVKAVAPGPGGVKDASSSANIGMVNETPLG